MDDESITYQWQKNENGDVITSNETNTMFKNNFSINAPFTLFDYIAVNPNININSDFVSRFRQVSLNADDEVEFNEIEKFKNRTTGNLSLSITTKIYGILPIRIGNISSVRHVMTPSITYSLSLIHI